MKRAKIFLGITFITVLALVSGACVPGLTPTPAPSATGTVQVFVTDAPPGDAVTGIMVTLSEVQIHRATVEREREQEQTETDNETETDNLTGTDNQTPQQERERDREGQGEWLTIDIADNVSTFDLLQLRGIEEYLGQNEVPAGKYTQVRLVVSEVAVTLGDGEPQVATLPSGVLKIVRSFDVVPGEATAIVLDFDADRMVTVTGNGNIIVKPVVKLTVKKGNPAIQADQTGKEPKAAGKGPQKTETGRDKERGLKGTREMTGGNTWVIVLSAEKKETV